MKGAFSVLDLVTKYDISELPEDTRRVLSSVPLTDTILLEEEAKQMLLHGAKYRRTAILQYLADNREGLTFVTFTKPAEANIPMKIALHYEKVRDKIPKDDHGAAAGNATTALCSLVT